MGLNIWSTAYLRLNTEWFKSYKHDMKFNFVIFDLTPIAQELIFTRPYPNSGPFETATRTYANFKLLDFKVTHYENTIVCEQSYIDWAESGKPMMGDMCHYDKEREQKYSDAIWKFNPITQWGSTDVTKWMGEQQWFWAYLFGF